MAKILFFFKWQHQSRLRHWAASVGWAVPQALPQHVPGASWPAVSLPRQPAELPPVPWLVHGVWVSPGQVDLLTGPQPMRGGDGVMRHLPYFCRGQVVWGFGHSSKQLGTPTANSPVQVVDNIPADGSTGIYDGWANAGSGAVHMMVASIGWNTKMPMEKSHASLRRGHL